LSQNSD